MISFKTTTKSQNEMWMNTEGNTMDSLSIYL